MSVPFLEFTVEQARNLPPLNRDGKTSDPYVILWAASAPKEEHKSKFHKREINPKYNETFGITFDPKIVKSGTIQDSMHLQFRHFKTIGIQLMGTELIIPLHDLKENQEVKKWFKIPGTLNGEVEISMKWDKRKQTEIPEIIKTHTGGSTKAFHNSITRTQLKKRIREGNRGMDKEVSFLSVKVHEARSLTLANLDTCDPFFSIYLQSSQQIVYKSKIQKGTIIPVWEAEFGFELVSVINNKVKDILRLDFRNYRSFGDSPLIGTLCIPLDNLGPKDTISTWHQLDGAPSGEVRITLTRTMKKVSDLPVQATKGSARVSKKLLYALSMVRRKMADFGMTTVIEVKMKMAVVETRISVKIEPMSPEEVDECDKEVEQAEKEVAMESEEGLNPEEEKESKSLFKSMLEGAINSLANNLKCTLKDMASVGLSGSVGASVILGVAMWGIEFEIGVDVEMDGGEIN